MRIKFGSLRKMIKEELIRESFFDRFKKKKAQAVEPKQDKSKKKTFTQEFSEKLGAEVSKLDIQKAQGIQHKHHLSLEQAVMRMYTHGELEDQGGRKPNEKRLKHLGVPEELWPKEQKKPEQRNYERHSQSRSRVAGDSWKNE